MFSKPQSRLSPAHLMSVLEKQGYHGDSVDGVACASLTEMEAVLLDQQGFRDRLSRPARGGLALLELAPATRADLQVITNATPLHGEAGEFLPKLYGLNSFSHPRQFAILIDEPCYVAPKSGVVFLADGRPLRETVYPSSGDQSFDRCIGTDCSSDEFAGLLASAPWVNPAGVPALLLSRWSSVYAHAMVEALVHDASLRRHGVTAHTSYLLPSVMDGTQNLVAAEIARHGSARTAHPGRVVRVPRVVVSSLLYRYSIYGESWRRLVAELLGACAPSGPELIYTSRIGLSLRQMENEALLAEGLKTRGFEIYSAQGQSLTEQVAAYSNARLIVGPHGSGLVNASFARPGTILFELRPLNRPGQNPMWDYNFLSLSASAGFRYLAHVTANRADAESWSADVPVILAEVDQLLAELHRRPIDGAVIN